MKILVVDDSELVLTFAKETFQQAGHEVETADNIYIAPQVRKFQPDVILMDVTVGTQRGTIAVEVLKHNTLGKNIKILLYSGASSDQLAQLRADSGADGVLEKTKDPAELLSRFEAQLKAIDHLAA